MQNYNKNQAAKLKPYVFSASVKNNNIQVKAYLKENALSRLQQIDGSITDCNLMKKNNSHQVPVDEVVETYPGEFQIKMIA